ncbi:TPA: hypothetical protein ACOTG0_002352 [Clostridium perfringens]
MFEFLLYFSSAYFIAYFLVMKICENCTLFDYINYKPIRAYISIVILFAIFILTSVSIDTVITSRNILDALSGLRIGGLIALLKQIKITKMS